MKIEVKLTADQIFYLESKLEPVTKVTMEQIATLSRTKKSNNSLLLDCFDKIQLKAKKISRQPSIFDPKKRYSLSFKYHEASILNALCCGLKDVEPMESYQKGCANSIYILIDKKL